MLNLDFSQFASGVPTSSLSGGGSPEQVVRAAAAYWQSAFAGSPEVVTQNLDFHWGPLDGPLAVGGTAWTIPDGRLAGGGVTFDSDGGSPFFVDPTPFDSTEYNSFSNYSANLGGAAPVNVGRNYFNANTTASQQFDLLTISIHEIGHALGLLGGYPGYDAATNGDGNSSNLEVTAPRPFAGIEIPAAGGHIPLDHANMAPGVGAGERKLLSEVDILSLAQTQGFSVVNLNPNPVPEPSAVAIVFAGAGLLARRRRKQAA